MEEKQYNPKELEKRVRDRWEAWKIPNKLAALDKKKKKFYLLDGPPYANADPHVGHVKTTALKDIWSKFKLLQGYSSWFQPGFDMHGLPIENIVQTKERHRKDGRGQVHRGVQEICRRKRTEMA